MTALYACSLRSLLQGGWYRLLSALPAERQQRALACRHDADSARIVAAGLLLQQALARHGVPPEAQRFTSNPWGKPLLAEAEHLQFSLSHSGNWVVCAVADHPVGVDLEYPRCSAAIARRYFHPLEAIHGDNPDSLCRIWTAKEAFVKALGVGLTLPLDSFLVCLHPDRLQLQQTHSPLPYRLHEYTMDTARICLCCTDEKPELTFL